MEALKTIITFYTVLGAYIAAPLVAWLLSKEWIADRPYLAGPTSALGLMSGLIMITSGGMLLFEAYVPPITLADAVEAGVPLSPKRGLALIFVMIWPYVLLVCGIGALLVSARTFGRFLRYCVRLIGQREPRYRASATWDLSKTAIDRTAALLFTAPADMTEEQRASLQGLFDWAQEQKRPGT